MNLLRYNLLIFFILFPSTCQCFSFERMKIQHAGEIGYYTIGVSAASRADRYRLELFHGIVPKKYGGRHIETFAVKNIFKFLKLDLSVFIANLYTGLNIYKVKGKRYETYGNNNYPENYYQISSVMWQIFMGGELLFVNLKHGVYLEFGLNNIALLSYQRNPNDIDLSHQVSLALGYIYRFR